jgi:hypothetical protein
MKSSSPWELKCAAKSLLYTSKILHLIWFDFFLSFFLYFPRYVQWKYVRKVSSFILFFISLSCTLSFVNLYFFLFFVCVLQPFFIDVTRTKKYVSQSLFLFCLSVFLSFLSICLSFSPSSLPLICLWHELKA